MKTALENSDAPEDVRVRLAMSPDGPLLEMDREEFNDESYSYHGKKVLVVDAASADVLTDDVLDVKGNQFCLMHREQDFSVWNSADN